MFFPGSELAELLCHGRDVALRDVGVAPCLPVALVQHGLPRLEVASAAHHPVGQQGS